MADLDISGLDLTKTMSLSNHNAEEIIPPTDITMEQTPPHRSHDPSNNLKRSDPFQFGSRYLLPEDNPYEFNAWDHVEPSAEDLVRFESQIEVQRAAPVSEFDRNRFNMEPEKWWNKFYANNTSNFFKDRKWLQQEFPVLQEVTQKNAGQKTLLEIGAGAGNTCFPILRGNENDELMVHACDFSQKAIDLIRENETYDEKHILAEVWDVASLQLPPSLEEGNVDVVLMVFIFSALQPTQWEQAVSNIWKLLKPGGEVCFRDYGRGDLAQVRMKKGRWMEENFYIRGDGTRVYFFGQDELKDIWSGKLSRSGNYQQSDGDPGAEPAEATGTLDPAPLFNVASLGVDRRLLINRHKQLKMYRCWMQGRFQKPKMNGSV
ncbi:MAG: hypothetical protein Q9169_002914 [Polycauliona sp. 2 TL-2023]